MADEERYITAPITKGGLIFKADDGFVLEFEFETDMLRMGVIRNMETGQEFFRVGLTYEQLGKFEQAIAELKRRTAN